MLTNTTHLMIQRFTVLLSIVLCGFASAQAQSLPAKTDVKRLVDSLGAAFVTTHGSPGVSIAVVRGGDSLAIGGWGFADVENSVAASSHTVYRVGSITKQFTAAAIMQLVEAKKLKVGDEIGLYLPSLPADWRGVTVQQLLNHTSGIPDYTRLGARWMVRWSEEVPPDTLVALTAKEPMAFKPGSRFSYDNSGYVVLGMLIEKLAGRTWARDLEERFFKPLQLNDTRYCDTHSIIPSRAHGYEQAPNGLFANAVFINMSQAYAAGALCSTVGDLVKWNSALANGRVVSNASYALMTNPKGAAADSGYGFGLRRDSLVKRTVVRHTGSIPGFISDNAWFPESQTSITVLTNSGSARASRLLDQVARATFGIPLLRVAQPVTISAETRAQYVGAYIMRVGNAAVDFVITEREGQIFAQLGKQVANPIKPLGNDIFGADFDDKVRITFFVEGGKASKLTLLQNGVTLEALRKLQ